MNLHKIAVLAVQESRTNKEDAKQIEEDNPGLMIINSGSHSNKTGVLFAINKRLLKQDEKALEKTHKILIKYRVSTIEIEWGQDQKTKIINVYAPNELKEKVEFYRELNKKIKQKEMGEFYLMGDTDCVLTEIDRSQPHADDEQVTEQLKKLIRKNNLIDIWREQNERERDYIFYRKGSGSSARIDRIYTTREMYNTVYNTTIESNFEISDHCLITVKIMANNLPHIGEGMWKLKDTTIANKKFEERTKSMLRDYALWIREYIRRERYLKDNEQVIKELRKDGNNPQSKWRELKEEVKRETIKTGKEEAKQTRKKVKNLKLDLHNQYKKMEETYITSEEKERITENIMVLQDKLHSDEADRIERAKKLQR